MLASSESAAKCHRAREDFATMIYNLICQYFKDQYCLYIAFVLNPELDDIDSPFAPFLTVDFNRHNHVVLKRAEVARPKFPQPMEHTSKPRDRRRPINNMQAKDR
jgi:hypothetical protein